MSLIVATLWPNRSSAGQVVQVARWRWTVTTSSLVRAHIMTRLRARDYTAQNQPLIPLPLLAGRSGVESGIHRRAPERRLGGATDWPKEQQRNGCRRNRPPVPYGVTDTTREEGACGSRARPMSYRVVTARRNRLTRY